MRSQLFEDLSLEQLAELNGIYAGKEAYFKDDLNQGIVYRLVRPKRGEYPKVIETIEETVAVRKRSETFLESSFVEDILQEYTRDDAVCKLIKTELRIVLNLFFLHKSWEAKRNSKGDVSETTAGDGSASENALSEGEKRQIERLIKRIAARLSNERFLAYVTPSGVEVEVEAHHAPAFAKEWNDLAYYETRLLGIRTTSEEDAEWEFAPYPNIAAIQGAYISLLTQLELLPKEFIYEIQPPPRGRKRSQMSIHVNEGMPDYVELPDKRQVETTIGKIAELITPFANITRIKEGSFGSPYSVHAAEKTEALRSDHRTEESVLGKPQSGRAEFRIGQLHQVTHYALLQRLEALATLAMPSLKKDRDAVEKQLANGWNKTMARYHKAIKDYETQDTRVTRQEIYQERLDKERLFEDAVQQSPESVGKKLQIDIAFAWEENRERYGAITHETLPASFENQFTAYLIEAICVAEDLLVKSFQSAVNLREKYGEKISVFEFKNELMKCYARECKNEFIERGVEAEYIRHVFRNDAELTFEELGRRINNYVASTRELKAAFATVTLKAAEEFNEIVGIQEKG